MSFKDLVLLSLIFVFPLTSNGFISEVIREPGRCVTFGFKGDSDDGLVNGINNTKAVDVVQPYPDIGLVCPSLANLTSLCCDAQQYMQLSQRLQQANAILNRCQACYQNFREFFCQYTCSPDQSLFKEVTKTTQNDAGLEVVRSVNFYVESNYAQAFFDSCKNIRFGATGEKLFDMLFHSAKTPYEWFSVLGSDVEHGGYSSEYIQFPFSNQPFPPNVLPLSSSDNRKLVTPCNTSDPMLTCSCSDCPSICPSANVLGSIASSNTDSGRSWLLTVLCLPTFLFIFGIILVSFPQRCPILLRSSRGEHRRYWTGKAQFERLGTCVASNPLAVIAVIISLVFVLGILGLPKLELLKDPVQLWTPKHSVSYESMLRSQESFGPNFRVQQIIISTKTGYPLFQNGTTLDVLRILKSARDRIQSLKTNDGIGFEDLCYRLAPGQPCLIQSVLGWFDKDEYGPSEAFGRLVDCTRNNYQEDCFDQNGLPTLSNVALAGYSGDDSSLASGAVLTFLLEGVADGIQLTRTEQWEQKLIGFLQNTLLDELSQYKVSFSTESSLETELNSQTTRDAVSVIVSYLFMFVYLTIALGKGFNLRSALLSARPMLALSAVTIVILSVTTACAICALAGVKMTLIISEVIPFIVLAIGVDNVFLITKSFDNQDVSLSRQERLSRTLADVGPSIALTTLCECGAFALGLLTTMPAVRAFACYAAVSVIVNLLLQFTVFTSALTLSDQYSQGNSCFCIENNQHASEDDCILIFIQRFISPLISKISRARLVCLCFCIASVLCMIPLFCTLELGLQPSIALPSSSYLQDYFQDVLNLLKIGPPMFMTVEADFSDENVQNSLCTLQQCNPDSLGQIMNMAAQSSDSTFVVTGASNFIDDYLQWLNPPFLHSQDSLCCRWNTVTNLFCDPDDFSEDCAPCIDNNGFDANGNKVVRTETGRPTSEVFQKLLPGFLSSNCSSSCIFCATPHYRNLQIVSSDNSVNITSARFMAYHKVLKSQRDFISALKSSRSLSEEISSRTSIPCYADSVFYVFFEQYLNIDSIASFAFIVAVLFVSILLQVIFRDFRVAIATSATLSMILLNVVGIMALLNININAVSVVNLITCVGLSVEFCVPVIYRYILNNSRTVSGMSKALSSTGSCVIRGILLTKICGLAVLFVGATRMVRIYYASMYTLICLIGATYGLIFLPAIVVLIDNWGTPDTRMQPLLSHEDGPSRLL